MGYHKLLRNILAQALPLLEEVEVKDFDFKSSPEKWSKKEILGHLIDSAYNNHRRFLMARSQYDLIFDGYEQVAWVERNRYQERQLEEIIMLWYTVNQHLAALIEGLPSELLERETADHNFHVIGMKRPEEGAVSSLAYLIWDYLFHLEHHLDQILEGYESILPAFSES
jgi:hypothetical protein